jgi:hypothetical protein
MAGLRHLLALQSIFFRIREQVSEISARAFVAPAQVRFVRRPCESYQGLLQMPKIARFRRSPVELNHQFSNPENERREIMKNPEF